MIPLSLFSVNIVSEYLLLLVSLLVFIAIMIIKVGAKLGMPSLLLFLILGMLVGRGGLGLRFDDIESAESLGHFAITIILFTGGLETSLSESRPIMKHGSVLSTLGVFLTALLTGVFTYLVVGKHIGAIGSSLLGCLLLASVMGSTDSASVFSVLRGRKLHLRERLAPLLELESGSNDPMAYILTIIFVKFLSMGETTASHFWTGAGILVAQVAIGLLVGLAVGYGAKYVLKKIELPGGSLYSILILSLGLFADGLASVLYGNGLLAIYVAAILMGNKAGIPEKKDVMKFFDGLTWLMQLLMFLMLGLLVDPSAMLPVALPALLIGLFMMFVARPASVFLSLLPFKKLSSKAKLYISWVGLKGAGPILFALYAVVAEVEGSSEIFNIVFFITLLSLITQGMTLIPMAKFLKLSYDEDPQVETFGMEIPEEMGMLRDHTVTEEDLLRGSTLREMNLPHGIRVMMVRRGEHFLVPHGSMKLQLGDHLVIVVGESDDDLIEGQ